MRLGSVVVKKFSKDLSPVKVSSWLVEEVGKEPLNKYDKSLLFSSGEDDPVSEL